MWRAAFGGLLVAHGLLTIIIWSPAPSADAPMNTSRSWLFGEARTGSVALAIVAGLLLVASGIGLLGHLGWWSLVGLAGGVGSLALFALFFTPWWLIAIFISTALFIVALRDRLPV